MDQATPIDQIRGFLAHAARESFPFVQFEAQRSTVLFYVLKELGFPVSRVQRFIHTDAHHIGGRTVAGPCYAFVIDEHGADAFSGLMGEATREHAQAQFAVRQGGNDAKVSAPRDWEAVMDIPVSAYRGNIVGELPKQVLEHMVREGVALFDQWQIHQATPTTPSVRISPRL